MSKRYVVRYTTGMSLKTKEPVKGFKKLLVFGPEDDAKIDALPPETHSLVMNSLSDVDTFVLNMGGTKNFQWLNRDPVYMQERLGMQTEANHSARAKVKKTQQLERTNFL